MRVNQGVGEQVLHYDWNLTEGITMANEPICIRRTSTVEEADIICGWLAERGINAEVSDRNNPGVFAFGVTDVEGIAICVPDAQTAEKAAKLLDEHDRERAHTADGPSMPVDVVCDGCGETCSFPDEDRGTVQTCPHCEGHLDVPGK
ncbi:MAG: hypothetical protein IIB61_08810, partial [Planctomycetes bacterium]|nr:hypothetical protein [Planctomycetota bacterium]